MASNLTRLAPIARAAPAVLARRHSQPALNCIARRSYLPSRYDPFEEMHKSIDRMFRDFDRAFASPFFYRPGGTSLMPLLGQTQRALPMIQTVDKDKRLLKIELDLPDFKPEDIEVTVKDGHVEISAKSESSGDSIKEYRQFSYRYALPKDADIEKVRSLLKADGRLVIEAPLPPQLEAAKQPAEDKEIPVKKD